MVAASMIVQLAAVAAVAALACGGRSPELASHDIATVFFISKSDDHNRVDYGIHLDDNCVPTDDAVFPYWHEFEPRERVHPLGVLDERAYGIDDQRVVTGKAAAGGELEIKLKRFDRPIEIFVAKQHDQCVAYATTWIDGHSAIFTDAFLQLGGLLSIDFVELHGRNSVSGAPLTERIKP
jgi:hypothetical protein